MFRNHISFSFWRIFRFRSRRSQKEKASSGSVLRRSSSVRRPVSPQPSSTDLSHPPFTPLEPHPVLAHSPDETPTQGDLSPIIIIEPDQAQPTITPLPIPILFGNLVPQIYVDGVLLLPDSPIERTHLDAHHVSFQVHNTTDAEESLDPPLSPSSTLVSHDVEYGYAVPMGPTTPEVPGCSSGRTGSVESDIESNDVARSESRKTRHRSLYSPRPVRAGTDRFSMPANRVAPTTTAGTNAKDVRRQSKRASAIPIPVRVQPSGTGPARRVRSSWSREMMMKPDTQEVLRALSGV